MKQDSISTDLVKTLQRPPAPSNRLLGGIERILYGDGITNTAVCAGVQVSGPVSEGLLTAALAKIQNKHPLLRASIRIDRNGKPNFIFEEEVPPIPVIKVQSKDSDDWVKWFEQAILEPLPFEKGPLAKLVWVQTASAHTFLLTSHHCICDGGALMSILHDFLTLLGNPELEIGILEDQGNLADCIPTATHVSGFKRSLIRTGISLMGGVLSIFNRFKKSKPTALGIARWELPQSLAAALPKACKAKGVSVHAALVAALGQAAVHLGDNISEESVTIQSPVNIRRFFPELPHDMMFPYAPTVNAVVRQEDEFWDAARVAKASVSEGIGEEKVYTEIAMAEHLGAITPVLARSMRHRVSDFDYTLSNMGKLNLDTTYGDIKVEQFIGFGTNLIAVNSRILIANMYQGVLSFMLIYNKALFSKEYTQILSNAMKIILQQACEGYLDKK